jgi:O-antigen/teichoic acid export membrane protein
MMALSSQGVQFLIQSVATVVLARLLTPADFGLVAMVTAVTGLASAFGDLGLSEATIQRKEITHDQVTVLFWINAAIGLGLTIITAALAPVFAWFYRESRLVNITLMLSLTFLICGLRVQPEALLKRQMRFRSLAIRDVVSYALAVPTAIIVALRGGSYWALVALPLTLNLTQMVISWLMANWKPGLPRRGTGVRSMVVFGGNVAASYLTLTLIRSTDNILIGWYWGAAPLGLYSRAYNLLMLPLRQFNVPVSSVAVSAFSKIHGEPERFARYYLRAISLVMWISAPLFGFLFVAAEPLIVLMLGAQWREAAPVFQFLAISAIGQLLIESTIWLLVSRGQSNQLLKLLLIISPVIVASFVIGLPFGIKWVALSFSLVLLSILPWILKFTFRGTDLTLRRVGWALLNPVSVCLAGVGLAELALSLFAPTRIISQFLVVALGFGLAYSLSALVPSVRKEIMSFRGLLRELRMSGSTA